MNDPIFAQLRTRIDAMESKAVREAATVILNIAATNANSVLAAHLEDALNASARVEGKIATFWSGEGENGINNHENALKLKEQGLNVYLYENTDVGQFVEKTSDYAWRTYLDHTYGEFTNLASAMMADQAKGPVIAPASL